MNALQVGDLLGKMSVLERWRIDVDEAVILTWLPAIGDLDYAHALEAMYLHVRESNLPVKAADLRAGVERILLAGLGTRQDEWGNDIDEDVPAVAAWRRLQGAKEIRA